MLGAIIVGLGAIICSRQDVLGGSTGPEAGIKAGLLDENGKLDVGKVVIVCHVEKGFGDVIWTLNIAEEVEKISNGRVTLVFYGIQKDEQMKRSIEFIEKNMEPKHIEGLEEMEIGNEEKKVYVCGRNPENREINDLEKRCGLVIIFHKHLGSSSGDENLSEKVVAIDEYGLGNNRSKILFKNYRELYGDLVEVDEALRYVKMKVQPSEFKEKLPEEQKEKYREDYMNEIIPSEEEYYLTYFGISCALELQVRFLKSICWNLCKFVRSAGIMKESGGEKDVGDSEVKKITVLTNIDIKKLAEQEFVCSRDETRWELKKDYSLNSSEKEEVMKTLFDRYEISSGESESILYLNMKKIGARVKLVHYSQLSPLEFDYALLRSEGVAGCTGDMSLSQVISSGRVPIYERLSHKKRLVIDLESYWREATGTAEPVKTFKTHYTDYWFVKYFSYYDGFWRDYKKFIEVLRKDSFQEWLYNEIMLRAVVPRMRMDFSGIVKVDLELAKEMRLIRFVHFSDLWNINSKTDGGVKRLIGELPKSGNVLGAYILEEKVFPQGLVVGMSVSEVRECISEVISGLDEIGGSGVAGEWRRDLERWIRDVKGTFEKYLEAIDLYLEGIARRYVSLWRGGRESGMGLGHRIEGGGMRNE